MKFWILILTPTFLLIAAPDTHAHNLVSFNGETQDHQHVYRRQEYGKPLQQGHLVQSPGGSSAILWGVGSRSDYGKLNGRRDGPIIGDQEHRPHKKRQGKKKYGATVYGYGKPAGVK